MRFELVSEQVVWMISFDVALCSCLIGRALENECTD